MFEIIRTHKRLLWAALMLLIIPSFVVVGFQSYQSRGDAGAGVAKVAGQKITQQEWDEAQRKQIDQYRQMLGARFDQKMFDSPEAKRAVLETLLVERSLNAELAHSNLTVSDAALQKAILDIPAFRKPDGSFDMEQYKAVLAAQRMTPTMFDARLRHDLALQQLSGSIQSTAFAPRSIAGRLSDINDQQREVQERVFPAANYLSQVKVTDEMLKAYYDKNAQLFQIPSM